MTEWPKSYENVSATADDDNQSDKQANGYFKEFDPYCFIFGISEPKYASEVSSVYTVTENRMKTPSRAQ